MASRSARVLLSVIGTAVLLVVGCGRADGPAVAVPELAGEPIVIATMGAFDVAATGAVSPELPGAVRARADAVNRGGGIGGRPVEVVECNIDSANRAAECAREAVDGGAVAVVGSFTPYDAQVVEVLEAAGVPLIGPYGASAASYNSPVSFPVTAGGIGLFYSLARAVTDAGATRVVAVVPDAGGSGASALTELYRAAVTGLGARDNGVVTVPVGAPDLAPVVAGALADGTDGIVLALNGDQTAAFLRALRQQGGDDVRIAMSSTQITPRNLRDIGPAGDGVLTALLTRPVSAPSPATEQFVADLAARDPDLEPTDRAAAFWAAAWVFERTIRPLPEVTPATVLDAMGRLEGLDMGGIIPDLTTTGAYSGFPGVPRMVNPTVVYGRVQDAGYTLLDGSRPFTDPFTGSS